MSQSPYRIAVAGLGTVGIGLLQLLESKADLITTRAQRPIEVIGINARSRTKDRGMDLSGYTWIEDPVAMPDLANIDGVVELIGGDSGTALALARKTLSAGKDFITANKALLALHGAELSNLAELHGGALAYEAAVAGAIPAIKVVRESLAGNQISKVGGILNGTCNYILSEMESSGAAYADVLKEAQALGYAEADPTTDVGGFDAAHKLTLLAALAFGHAPNFAAVQVRGIEMVSDKALKYADQLGYRIRLIGLAEGQAGSSQAFVQPMVVPTQSPLGQVTGPYNAVQAVGDEAADIFLRGRGAGRKETASAIAGDVIDLALGLGRLPFGVPAQSLVWPTEGTTETSGQEARLCVLTIRDAPGAMASLTQILASFDVSVDQLFQPAGHEGRSDLALITHVAPIASLDAAFATLGAEAMILEAPETYRIETFEA